MTMVDRLSRAVVSRIVAAKRTRRPPVRFAAAVASAVARRLASPPARARRRAVQSGDAFAGGRAAASIDPIAASLAPRSLQGARVAGRVARQIASQLPEARLDFSHPFSDIDVAKVAAAVVSKLDQRRQKKVDPVDVLASQIAARLSSPRLQGSAAGAADFHNRVVSAVAQAVALGRADPVQAAGAAAPSVGVTRAAGSDPLG